MGKCVFHNVFVTKMLVTNLRVRIGDPDPLRSRRPSRRAASRASCRATGTSRWRGTRSSRSPPSQERTLRTARDGETVGANRRARDRSEGPPTHEGIESALGPTAALPTRVGHLSPPARRAVEEFGRRERIVLEETATGHGPSGVTRSGRAADHGVSSGAEGRSMTLSGRTRAANRESRDAGGDARVGRD